jgi:hypothetical protein
MQCRTGSFLWQPIQTGVAAQFKTVVTLLAPRCARFSRFVVTVSRVWLSQPSFKASPLCHAAGGVHQHQPHVLTATRGNTALDDPDWRVSMPVPKNRGLGQFSAPRREVALPHHIYGIAPEY